MELRRALPAKLLAGIALLLALIYVPPGVVTLMDPSSSSLGANIALPTLHSRLHSGRDLLHRRNYLNSSLKHRTRT